MNRMALLVLSLCCHTGASLAADGFGPSRPYRPSYLAKESAGDDSRAQEDSTDSETASAAAPGWSGMFGSIYAPVVEPGQAAGEPEPQRAGEITEMKSTGESPGELGARASRSEPRVHGEFGVSGRGSFGTVVVESDKPAITVSGQRYSGWW